MNIEFYSISDDRKKIKKTLNPLGSINAQLKTPCSIMKPVLQIKKSALGTEWYRVNYAHIDAFGRYYFVENVTAENDGIISMELSIDVLYTYKEQLLNTQFQVVRAQRSYDSYFVDTQIPLRNYKAIRQDKDIDFIGSLPQDVGDAKYNYVMTVAGG